MTMAVDEHAELRQLRAEFDAACDAHARVEIAGVLEQLRQGPAAYMYVETEPPAYARALATSALEIVQRDLGIPGLKVLFFRRFSGPRWPFPEGFAFASDLDCLGAYQASRPDVLWVKGDFHGGPRLVYTVLHEARHAERDRRGVTFASSEER